MPRAVVMTSTADISVTPAASRCGNKLSVGYQLPQRFYLCRQKVGCRCLDFRAILRGDGEVGFFFLAFLPFMFYPFRDNSVKKYLKKCDLGKS